MKTTRTVDTNILVRLFAQDDDEQWATASDIITRYRLVVLSTVLLETEWVLRSRYSFGRPRIIALFQAMLLSENFIFAERERVIRTLEAFSNGIDFADAFHISTFITFDRNLVKLAQKHMNSVSVELAS
ncbi:type II toxin-antitoxin system VapC family toxin [Rhizobium metallidurans]|uniref:Putative nucleic-acid-binding protein n=1 Tax=Rhizobium metallidurans TaxID=1265931 RepID=A0A7W6CLQ4_9HYPH|nr:type II toxin-antitoxin system VapC family toxin [Rhizobium metallidurans]MBB3963345.1 putative nucleic-acid-binding protein [Rhizobium metallidurans]